MARHSQEGDCIDFAAEESIDFVLHSECSRGQVSGLELVSEAPQSDRAGDLQVADRQVVLWSDTLAVVHCMNPVAQVVSTVEVEAGPHNFAVDLGAGHKNFVVQVGSIAEEGAGLYKNLVVQVECIVEEAGLRNFAVV